MQWNVFDPTKTRERKKTKKPKQESKQRKHCVSVVGRSLLLHLCIRKAKEGRVIAEAGHARKFNSKIKSSHVRINSTSCALAINRSLVEGVLLHCN
jgi:hypothetical protein